VSSATAGRLSLPAGRKGEGGERPRACANSFLLGPPRHHRRGRGSRARRSVEEMATQLRDRRAGAGEPVRVPPTPPARPGFQGQSPGPGRELLRSGPGTARSPAQRSLPCPPRAGPGAAAATRRATPGRGDTGGVTTLRAPRSLLGLLPGTHGCLSSGHGGVSFLVPLLCPPAPSWLLGSCSPLPVAQSRAALFNNPSASAACTSRAALALLPSQSCC
jgi:hypothetical protein